MTKQIHVNAFEMATPGHINHGLWRVPGNRRTQYKDLGYWTDLAQLLERGLFDAVFLADVVGTYTTYRGDRRAALKAGMQVPNIDPAFVVPAMAAVTRHLGFAVTSSTSYEPPFSHARRLSTLDHLTGGRLAWNVVTGYLPDAARNYGLPEQVKHDERYAIAEEYLEVVYRLLESSWEDDAVVLDGAEHTYTDPDKVHEIGFEGEHFQVAGPHLSEPSPQRTPVLYQAGTSSRGKAFAARHAEAVFLLPRDDAQAREEIADLRRLAVEAGRSPEHVKAFIGVEVVVGRTQAEVDQKIALLVEHRDVEGHLVLFSGWAGIDLSGDDTDSYLEYRGGDAMQTFERMWSEGEDRKKVGELVQHLSRPENNTFFVAGTPEQVADRIEEIIDGTDADGINLIQHLSPATFADFVDLVVPELQRRGRYRTAYTPEETLRERLFGTGNARALPDHPAATHRPAVEPVG
ncbi:LLM class flavin-dependent oxidoreductase [Actinotalea sp. BY-33]|uniref:LLM class flavin-dependent oxidoreductase n=1 Tax=Actinotalea soli TaxID=2819234 RepID=A0A939LNE4_9CELL|nr:LLM class flavin-dependent oxidoreductase [Actinotalea soli]MBO1751587.1 LLM class flavin-dependent oxidoreductase [Actinotalea soli]